MSKTRLEKIDSIDEEIARLRRRQTLLKQEHNKQARKDRTYRLCRRGGIVEKLLPDIARITDEQFDIFIGKVLLTPHTARILAGLAPPLPDPGDEPDGNGSGAPDESASDAKPTVAVNNSGADTNGVVENGDRA